MKTGITDYCGRRMVSDMMMESRGACCQAGKCFQFETVSNCERSIVGGLR
jgi:hypothetical protein